MSSTKVNVARELVLILGLAGVGATILVGSPCPACDDQGPGTVSPSSPARAVVADTDPKREIVRISDRIKENYARLRTVNVLLQTSLLDRAVTKREEVTTNLPNGGTARSVQQPFSVQRERVLLRGDELRRESMGEDGETWTFHDGVWTQYVPKSNTAWRRMPDQMPGVSPLDPRNIASLEQRWLFVDRLRGDRVLEIGPTQTSAGQPRIVALMEHTLDSGGKQRYRCEFDPSRNHLPTRIVFLREEGKIGIVLDIAYQEVISGTAWFFEKATCKFFGPELVRSPDSDAWRQALIVETKGRVHVNEAIAADAFAVKLPTGTRVIDATRRVTHKNAEKRPPR